MGLVSGGFSSQISPGPLVGVGGGGGRSSLGLSDEGTHPLQEAPTLTI